MSSLQSLVPPTASRPTTTRTATPLTAAPNQDPLAGRDWKLWFERARTCPLPDLALPAQSPAQLHLPMSCSLNEQDF